MRELARSRPGRLALVLTGLLALGTAIGVAALWPGDNRDQTLERLLQTRAEQGEVTVIKGTTCLSKRYDDCRLITVRLESGDFSGAETTFKVGDGGYAPRVDVGDQVSVLPPRNPSALQPGSAEGHYTLGPPDRDAPLLWLAAAFAILVAAIAGWRGLRSIVGLALSVVVVFAFIVPAILDGRPALLVALVGAFAVMLLTTISAHGLGAKSVAAILGTAASLVITLLLAEWGTDLVGLTGFSSQNSQYLRFALPDVSLEGLLLAGIVIGTLGVLDDVTVSQASTVMALRRANPAQRGRELFREALGVGRDHVAATVNTLVLAYVGASLPLLLVFGIGSVDIGTAIDGEAVAEEITGTLVGSIGLVAAMPLTTALAALLAARLPVEAIGDDHHGHAH